jgi:hypothetical protein
MIEHILQGTVDRPIYGDIYKFILIIQSIYPAATQSLLEFPRRLITTHSIHLF